MAEGSHRGYFLSESEVVKIEQRIGSDKLKKSPRR